MTEAVWTAKLLRALRVRMPEATCIKFNDRTTAGIPDFCIVRNGRTTWWEVKLASNKHPFELIQWEMLRKMQGKYIMRDGHRADVVVMGLNKEMPKTQVEFRKQFQCLLLFDELIDLIERCS